MAAATLITGASGLIGSHVVAAWPDDLGGMVACQVAGEPMDLLQPDAAQRLLDATHPQRVLHLAWVASSTAGYRHDPRNKAWVDATVNLAEQCLARGIAFVGTGTVAETGADDDLYTTAKREVRRRVEPFITQGAIAWLQPHYVFSEQSASTALVRAAIAAQAAGRPLALTTPLQQHDFVEVRDVARAVIAVLRHRLKGCVPIGSGRTHTVAEVARALGATVSPYPSDAPTTGSTPAADISALLSTGWLPAATKEFFGDE